MRWNIPRRRLLYLSRFGCLLLRRKGDHSGLFYVCNVHLVKYRALHHWNTDDGARRWAVVTWSPTIDDERWWSFIGKTNGSGILFRVVQANRMIGTKSWVWVFWVLPGFRFPKVVTVCLQWFTYSEPNYRLFCMLSQMLLSESRKNRSLLTYG